MNGWILAIDGSPIQPATAGIASVAPGAHVDWVDDWTVLAGKLEPPDSTIKTTLHPLEGKCEVNSQRFIVHDAPYDFGGSVGVRSLFTWLATRDDDALQYTTLAQDFEAGDATFTVASGTGALFDGVDVVWIDGEAVAISGRTGDLINVAGSGRGYFGTQEETHVVDPETSDYPEVFVEFPWISHRRVVLYYVSRVVNGVAMELHPFWRGHATRPRGSNGGAEYEIHCEHLLKRYEHLRMGAADAVCRLRGYSRRLVMLNVVHGQGDSGHTNSDFMYPDGLLVMNSLDDLGGALARNINARLLSDLGSPPGAPPEYAKVTCSTSGSQLGAHLELNDLGEGGSIEIRVAPRTGDWLEFNEPTIMATATASQAADPRSAGCAATLPPVLVESHPGGSDIPINRTDRLPTNWAATTAQAGPFHAEVRPILRGVYSEDEWLEIVATSDAPITANNFTIGGPTITGVFRLVPRKPGVPSRDLTTRGAAIDLAVSFVTALHVRTDHWALGIKTLITDTTFARSGIDSRDWDLNSFDAVIAATPPDYAARDWVFDGSEGVLDFIVRQCLANGCGIAVRGSKLALVAYGSAPSNVALDATITEDDLVDKPHPYRFEDGIANVANAATKAYDLRVRNKRSVRRYGEGKTIEIDLTDVDAAEVTASPTLLAATVLARVLGNFDRPLHMTRLPLNWSFHSSAECGDFVSISEWLCPDGAGDRGLSARVGQVLGHERVLRSGVVWIDALLMPGGVGYSPCVRVASISGAVLTIATDYIGADGDYSGSTRPGYEGLEGDGGVSFFTAGDRIQLVLRNDTSTVTLSAVVLSVNPGALTITLTAAPGTTWEDYAVDAGGVGHYVDARFNSYGTSGLQDAQKAYAWVGNATTGNIGASSDAAQQWRP